MLRKRIISLLLSAALLVSFGVTALGANFSDINGHWAQTYLEDMVKRGYMSGYTDGTIKPDGLITACEALVILARVYDVDEQMTAAIHKDYGSAAERLVPDSLSWARDEIEIALAAGVITEEELREIELSKTIEKELIALFTVRMMGLADEAESYSSVTLKFDDASDITEAYRGHVALLTSVGIITGSNDNKFYPFSSVSRAVFAAMLSRTLEYMEKNDFEALVEGYENIVETGGILTAVDTASE
jgi:hypothetical protein